MVIDWNIQTNLIVIKIYKVRVQVGSCLSFLTCSNMYLIIANWMIFKNCSFVFMNLELLSFSLETIALHGRNIVNEGSKVSKCENFVRFRKNGQSTFLSPCSGWVFFISSNSSYNFMLDDNLIIGAAAVWDCCHGSPAVRRQAEFGQIGQIFHSLCELRLCRY